jgi:acetyl-CoA carboxylase biotin carboxyl carrier protein
LLALRRGSNDIRRSAVSGLPALIRRRYKTWFKITRNAPFLLIQFGKAHGEMAESPKRADDVFDIDRIRKLIELMKEHELGEIDLRQENQRIRLCGTGHGQPIFTGGMMQAAPAAPVAIAPPAATTAAATSAPADVDGPHIVIVKSPMVGTFYSRPNPNSKNFVEPGSVIQKDTIVCIIEAMKVFNDIPAEVQGKIVQVLVKNEEAVDFGRPLFKVDTRG